MEQESNITSVARQVAEAMTKAAATFIEAFDKAIPVLKQFLYDWAWVTGATPAHRYALAGYPYGKHTKGKKRFLREMKARHRQ